jgi:hypothetical protein
MNVEGTEGTVQVLTGILTARLQGNILLVTPCRESCENVSLLWSRGETENVYSRTRAAPDQARF